MIYEVPANPAESSESSMPSQDDTPVGHPSMGNADGEEQPKPMIEPAHTFSESGPVQEQLIAGEHASPAASIDESPPLDAAMKDRAEVPLDPIHASSEPEQASGPEDSTEPERKGIAASVLAAAGVSALVLKRSLIAPELVALHDHPNGAMACYEGVAGTVLGSAWRRSSLFFTGVQPGQGATATAINLATALSQRADSVLLVELQLTAPSMWSMLGQPTLHAGIEEALRGKVSFEDCLSRIEGQDLNVLLVKQPMSVEEADHLSGGLNDFLEWAEERFSWLVVDCPPVLGPAWTKWFQLNADPVVLVARRAKTRKIELRTAARILDGHLVSTILNCA